MTIDHGRSASPSGHSQAEPEEVSALRASVPNAALAALATVDELTAVYENPAKAPVYPYAQLQFAGQAYGADSLLALTIWDNEPTRAHRLGDAAEKVISAAPFKSRLMRRRVVRDLAGPWACAIDWRVNASAIEARRAATAETGAVHESAVGAAETPNTGRGTSHG